MNTYLVTGGAGFIGSHLSRALLERGDSVLCIDNFNEYYKPEYKRDNVAPLLENNNYELIEADITDWNEMQSVFDKHGKNITSIIHLAARAGVRSSIAEPQLYTSVNVGGTINLLEAARLHKINKFVLASSSSVYGNQEKIPFSETDPVDMPISPYAATKKSCELLLATYHHLYNIDSVALRFFTVYGPQGRPDMAPYLFTELISNNKPINRYGDGTTHRDYTFIDDIIQGVIASIDRSFGYEIINLGNSNTVTLNEFIAIVEKHLDKKAIINERPMQPGDVNKTFSDISKAKKLLDFEPKTSFADGMKIFIDWYKENRT